MPKIGDMSYGMTVGAGESLRVKADGSAWEFFRPLDVSEVMRLMFSGAMQSGTFAYMGAGVTASGSFSFYITSDGTSTGTPVFSTVFGVFGCISDNSGVFPFTCTVSPDKKQLTASVTKQGFVGLTVLGLNVLGSVTFAAAPNGTGITLIVIGK